MIVMISSPLEAELVERVRAVDGVSEVLYDPTLLPEIRYPNDHSGIPGKRDAAGSATWNAMIARANVLFGYPDESSAGLRDSLERGQAIRFVQGTSAGMGAHVRRAQFDAAMLARVRFASAAGVHAGMLAEFAFYGLLALRKDARRLQRIREARGWDHFVMGELDGSTIGILGMGQIGVAIARRARAFGMSVIAVSRTGALHDLADRSVAMSELLAIAPDCDAIVVTLPITDLTNGLVSASVLAALPRHAIVVNVGRGAVIDQAALIDALADGRLAGAVLDVFAEEPLPADNPLWTMDNVIFSPHTAAISLRENARIVEVFCENLTRLRNGSSLKNALNLDEFY